VTTVSEIDETTFYSARSHNSRDETNFDDATWWSADGGTPDHVTALFESPTIVELDTDEDEDWLRVVTETSGDGKALTKKNKQINYSRKLLHSLQTLKKLHQQLKNRSFLINF